MTKRILRRPEPILRHDATRIDRTTNPGHAARRLSRGETLLVTDHYGTGVEILEALQALIPPPHEPASYAARRAHREKFSEAASRLLAPIADHWLALKDAGAMEFLAELYPDTPRFFLPLTEVQELHGAWLRYREGVRLAVLGHSVHPFYGTYAPTRTSHLELFGTWLSQYDGPKQRAIDVGTGCGVLALMLCKSGFDKVLATDSNPNAIESVARELKRRGEVGPVPPIELFHGDLLGEDPTPANVVVFNPPWMKGTPERMVDEALFFDDETLFERFFTAAAERLTPEGRVVVIFSNVMELVQPDEPHPIEAELERGRLHLVQKLRRKVQPAPDASGRRRRTKERVEVWELALGAS